jgi:cytosine/creatinine deaminase
VSGRRLDGVSLSGRPGAFNLEIRDGVVLAVRPADEPTGRTALPALADLHLHADRAFLRPPGPPRSLEDAIATTLRLREAASAEDVRRRARRLFERALIHGALRLRTHVDVDDVAPGRSLEGVLAARAEVAGPLDVEIVAFATSSNDPAEPEGQALLRQALAGGADHVGGVVNLYADPGRSIDALLDLAAETGCEVDVHVDETVEAADTWVDRLARGAVERGLVGRLSVSHGCVLSRLSQERVTATIDALLEARATVVVLPSTNLYLQDRGEGTPRRRGLTVVRELLRAGVPVRFASDNVADAFYPYGDADPLEAAFLASLAAHVDEEAALLAGIAGGRNGVGEGDPADLVVLPVPSFTEALRLRPAGRVVLRRGEVVAGTLDP